MSADKQTRNRKPRKPRSDFQRLSRRFMSGLLRSLFFINKPTRTRQAGFVLPTTALLLLVLTLTVGAMSFRTFSRSSSVIAQREQQVVDSAAAPTIDRAKAKLEYLFSKDSRFPGGVPASDVLASMMLNDNTNGIPTAPGNPYTFPGETRLDINRDSVLDNAWLFKSDINGDGQEDEDEVIVYSILMDDANDDGSITITNDNESLKAQSLINRNGPINTSEALSGCGAFRAPEDGWQGLNSSTLQKNFQVTAFVANRSDVNRTVSTLEFQQVRQANRGNKWGAWFKYDIELFPGSSRDFFWNGAMHTEGNLLAYEKFKARMISSHNSCLYTQDASEITLGEKDGFQGQLLAAKVGTDLFYNTNNKSAEFHFFNGNGVSPIVTTPDNPVAASVKLKTPNDSVAHNSGASDVLEGILLDPIKLFAEDTLAHRSPAASGFWVRTTSWLDTNFFKKNRVYNDPDVKVPYLDDTYRADSRYGPKAVYDDDNSIPSGSTVGDEITGNIALTAIDPTAGAYGLDGYWERRSIGQGLRLIVGQRLELGNTFGWEANDPLYPPNQGPNAGYDPATDYLAAASANGTAGDADDVFTEEIQRRSLYDNLAAVQGMVVYHYTDSLGDYPLACVASTAHPGTRLTLINSRDFREETFKDEANQDVNLVSNFLTGKGTNGWEYEFPTTFPYTTGGGTSFGDALATNRPLGIALRNLAHFAGDPNGGAPSFSPVQDDVVHPYPNMAMWGDYSVLRRIFDERLDIGAGTISSKYDALSPADKSSLHSAACTMGLLSKNLTGLSKVNWENTNLSGAFGTSLDSQGDVITEVGKPIWNDAFGITNSGPAAGSLAERYCTERTGGSGPGKVFDCTNPTKEELIAAGGTDISGEAQSFIRGLSNFTQVERDRKYGFQPTPASTTYATPFPVDVGNDDYYFSFPDDCEPRNASSVIAPLFNSNTGAPGQSSFRAGVALVCATQPKYPALHYLFPVANHDHNDGQPVDEEYIDPSESSYIFDDTDPSNITGVNAGYVYKVVGDNDNDGTEDPNELGMGAIAFDYKTTWALPKVDTTTDAAGSVDTETMEIINTNGNLSTVALLDKGMYDGRENMGSRMLDLDINLLTTNSNGGDHWIADTDGIVYAFREDAKREDSIVRPKKTGVVPITWENCNSWDKAYGGSLLYDSTNCRMKQISSAPYLQDPPLMTGTLINSKPIDFYPDPERRPYGFRLINGQSLNRANDVLSGMTFVSDNMVYIKGDFNLHATGGFACANLLEEFDTRLDTDCDGEEDNDFYGDRNADDPSNAAAAGYNYDRFANPAVDTWRPVEIVGDAIGILSGRFRDGNIKQGFVIDRSTSVRSGEPPVPTGAGGRGMGISSYMNQNRVEANNMPNACTWKYAGPSSSSCAGGDVATPIVIDRNGQIERADGTTYPREDLLQFTDSTNTWNDRRGADTQRPSATRVNAVFISGIVPSQIGQSYGGLHNFPRLNEWWQGIDLSISGGFFQLNFSTSATGPFDADAWEPGSSPTKILERIAYYGAADRSWGYDVGLQYAPAGPIARRFVTIGRPRSEFYRELPVEDPYVLNLRCAEYTPAGGTAQKIDPTATGSCPT